MGKCVSVQDLTQVPYLSQHTVRMEEDKAGQRQGRAGKGKKAFV